MTSAQNAAGMSPRSFDFQVFAEEVPADVAPRIAKRFAEAMGDIAMADTLDSNIIKAMLVQLGSLGVGPEEMGMVDR